MKRIFHVIVLCLFALHLHAAGPQFVAVIANTNGTLATPTNFFISNLVAGANVTITAGAGGKVTVGINATNVVSTNFDGIIVTNVIRGTNYDFYTATNTPQGILTWEWWTNLASTIIATSGTNFPSIYVTNYIQGTNAIFYTATNVPDGILTWRWWTNLASTISGNASNAIANWNGKGTNTIIWSTNDSVPLRIYGAVSQSADFLEVLDSTSNLVFYITETGALTGNGEGLTNLNATQLKTGTVPLARLSGITSNQIADVTITSNQIASGTITTNKMSKEAHEAYVGGSGSGVVTNAHLTNLVNIEYKSYTNSAFVTNVWYVAPWGSDSNPGTPLQPLATLSNAVYLTDARSNSTIFVEAGEYLIPGQYNAITNLGDTTVAGSIRMHYKGNVRIVPLGLVNFYAPTGYSVISMKGCSNIYIGPGLRIRTGKTSADVNALSNSVNGNPNRFFGSIHLNHSEDVTIDGVTIEDALCYGIFCNNESGPSTATNVFIRNCNTIHCGTSMGDPAADESARWYLDNTNYFGGGYSIGGGNSLDNCSSFEDQVGVYLRNISSVGRHRAVSITRAKIINPNFRGIFSGPYQNFDGLLLKDSYLRRITNGMHAAGGAGTLTLPFMFPVRGAELCEVGMNNFTAADTTFEGGWQAIQQVGGYVTNWLVTGCTFNDCWCYTVQPVNYNAVGFGSKISRCTFNNCGQYAIIYSGSIFECAVEDNMINGYGLVEASQAAIGFKLAPAISNVTVLRNTIIGPVVMNGLHAIDFGTTNSHIGHVIAGANWVSRTDEAIRIASYYGILSRDLPMIFETNAARTLAVLMPDPFTNAIVRTNYYAETNWVGSLVSATAGSATNAIASVWSNGTPRISAGATNLNFIAGNANTDILVSNNPAGQANIIISASAGSGDAGGTNARQYGSFALSNITAMTLASGDILYRHANALTNLTKGGAGTYLQMDGTGTYPAWSPNTASNTAWQYGGSTFGYCDIMNVVVSGGLAGMMQRPGGGASLELDLYPDTTLADWAKMGTNQFAQAAVTNSFALAGWTNAADTKFAQAGVTNSFALASWTNQVVLTNNTTWLIRKLTNQLDVSAVNAANGQALFFNTDGKWYPSNVSASASVGTNFYNAEVSNSVRALNGTFTNLTVYSNADFALISVSALTLSNAAPGVAYFSAADTNLTNLANPPSGTKVLYYSNSLPTWHDPPSTSGDPGGTNARQWGTASLSNLSAITFSTGDLIYKHANGLTNLGIGTAGQYLASMGGVPTWSNGPSGVGSADMPQMWIRTNLYASNAFLLSLTVTNSMNISTVNVQRMTATNMEVTTITNAAGVYATNLFAGGSGGWTNLLDLTTSIATSRATESTNFALTVDSIPRNPQTNSAYTIFLSTNSTVRLTNNQSGNVTFYLTNPVDRCWFVVRLVAGSAGVTNLFTPMDSTTTFNWLSTNGCPNATNPAAASGKICTIVGRVWVSPIAAAGCTNVDLFANVQP